jgi:MFS family permease
MSNVHADRFDDGSRLRAITAAIASISVVGIGLSLSIPLLSLEMERMGIPSLWIGLNTAIAGIASILVVPFVPRLAARFGVATLLWTAVVAAALTLLAFKLVPVFWLWFPIRFVFSAALGTLFVLSEFWINAAAPPHKRGLIMGIYATVLAAGFAVGPGILTLVGTTGWPPYAIGTVLFLMASIPLLVARGLTPDVEGHAKRSVLGYVVAAPIATMAALVFGAVETGGFAILPVYGLRVGFDAETAALLVSLVAAGNVLLQIPIGLLADRIDRRLILLVTASAGALGAAAIPFTIGNTPLLYATLVIWGGLIGSLYTVGLAHLGARFGGADLASANAAFVVLYNVGLVMGPPFVGWGLDAMPPHGFAWTLSAMFVAYVLVVLWRLTTSSPASGPGRA